MESKREMIKGEIEVDFIPPKIISKMLPPRVPKKVKQVVDLSNHWVK